VSGRSKFRSKFDHSGPASDEPGSGAAVQGFEPELQVALDFYQDLLKKSNTAGSVHVCISRSRTSSFKLWTRQFAGKADVS